mmetsp:Transcript_17397/g.48514  ORF Transcript_17397/g.48514 Transcript_17397/m.48514 type:complete len:252 (-) Transcript_17397:295-1050(-)
MPPPEAASSIRARSAFPTKAKPRADRRARSFSRNSEEGNTPNAEEEAATAEAQKLLEALEELSTQNLRPPGLPDPLPSHFTVEDDSLICTYKNMFSGMLVTENDGLQGFSVLFAGSDLLELLGLTEEDVLGNDAASLLIDDADRTGMHELRAALQATAGAPKSLELSCKRRDGSKFTNAVTVMAVPAMSGEDSPLCISLHQEVKAREAPLASGDSSLTGVRSTPIPEKPVCEQTHQARYTPPLCFTYASCS